MSSCNPFPLPITLLEQSHFKGRRRAVGAFASPRVPYSHLPVDSLSASKFRPPIKDLDGVIGCDFTAVPFIPNSGFKILKRGRDEYLISALQLPSLTRFDRPSESRLR